MPAPTTTDQLADHLRKSGLVPADALERFLEAVAPGDGPADVLDHLVAGGLLTRFQADRLAAGKYKGFVLGGYVIRDRLGGGGMGQVFLAEHTVLRRLVALKVLAVGGGNNQVALERFLREARAASALRHPNIVGVHDLRKDGAVFYLVMEYVEGQTLQAVVNRHGPLVVATAAGYARQVALGLQHAHEHGFVHRDIKPANLLLGTDGVVRILDLGLVRSVLDPDAKLTGRLDRAILGTADYLAPEQAVNSSGVDIRADVYSLGATLYFLLAGRPLFPDGRTAQKLMWQQLREPDPIGTLRPDVPPGLAAVVHKALAKKPADRHPTPAALAAALAPWTDDDSTPPPQPGTRPDFDLDSPTAVTADASQSPTPALHPPEPQPRPADPLPLPADGQRTDWRFVALVALAAVLVGAAVGVWLAFG